MNKINQKSADKVLPPTEKILAIALFWEAKKQKVFNCQILTLIF